MVNNEQIVKRIETILEYYGLNASGFADKIGVQRSSLSHLLSGRNKPSLDFILKVIEVFPEVDLYWFLNGRGSFPKQDITTKINYSPPTPIVEKKITLETQTDLFSSKPQEDNFRIKQEEIKLETNENISTPTKTSEIDQIVIFYKNGTFKIYTP